MLPAGDPPPVLENDPPLVPFTEDLLVVPKTRPLLVFAIYDSCTTPLPLSPMLLGATGLEGVAPPLFGVGIPFFVMLCVTDVVAEATIAPDSLTVAFSIIWMCWCSVLIPFLIVSNLAIVTPLEPDPLDKSSFSSSRNQGSSNTA